MAKTRKLKVGDKAPDFVLKNHHNKEFLLSEHKGKKIVLSFHPLAFTKVCGNQMKSLEANHDTLEQMNAVAVGLSVDPWPSKHAWAKELGVKQTLLLSDFWPHGGVAQKYGIFRENLGISERANIILDEELKVAFIKVYDIPELPDIQEILDFVKSMK